MTVVTSILHRLHPDTQIIVGRRSSRLPGAQICFAGGGSETVIIMTDAQIAATVDHLNAFIAERENAREKVVEFRGPTRRDISHTGPSNGPEAA